MTTTTDLTAPPVESSAVFRARLDHARADLLAQLATTVPRPEHTATTGQGETEHVSSEVEHRVRAVLDAGSAARIEELDDALRRLDDGTYGHCRRCGGVIPTARLEALPEARLCVPCQAEQDGQRRRRLAR
jgi:DnaK suppressor protein